jgi:hypothetical protein
MFVMEGARDWKAHSHRSNHGCNDCMDIGDVSLILTTSKLESTGVNYSRCLCIVGNASAVVNFLFPC